MDRIGAKGQFRPETDMKSLILPMALAAAFAMPFAARAAEPQPVPRILVIGEGEAAAAPDMAMLSLTVLRSGDTARQALDANTAAMNEVIAALKAKGIEARDLQTSSFSVNPRWFYPVNPDGSPKNEPPKITGYDVSNSLTVRVRDLSKVGDILDTSVTLGVNQGGTVSFVNDDTTAILTSARKAAMADALSRAKTLTEAAGASVGKILEISEQNFRPQPMPMMEAKAMMASDGAGPVPVQAGENTYRVTVSVTFEIKQ